MNRLNKKNTKLILTSDMEFQVQEPFLLCKASNSEIIGIWFYDQEECQRFGSLLRSFVVLAKDETSLKIAIMMEAQKKKGAQVLIEPENNIMGMFSRAQDEYKKSRAKFQSQAKGKSNQKSKNQNKQILMRQMSVPDNHKSQKQDQSPGTVRKEKIQKQQLEFKQKHENEQEILLNILHGGKQQKIERSRTMSSSDNALHSNVDISPGYSSKAGDLAIFDELGISQETQSLRDVKSKAIGCAELEYELLNSGKKGERKDKPNGLRAVNSEPNFNQLDAGKQEAKSSENLYLSFNSSMNSNTVSLLSPTVITAKAGKGRGTTLGVIMNGQQQKNISIAANFKQNGKSSRKLFPDDEKPESKFPETLPVSSMNSLMSPAAFLSKSSSSNTGVNGATSKVEQDNGMILSKEQFQEAIIHLIKNDENFVQSLHAAYLDVQRKR